MSLFTTWFGMFFLVCCWAIHHWFSQKMCLLFGASSWEDGLRMFIFGKNCAGCMVRELYGWRRVDAGALMFILFQLMQLTFFTVGHPSSAQGLWIGEFTFGRIHLLVLPIYLTYLLYSSGVRPPWFHEFMKARQQDQNFNGEIGLHTNSNFKLS